MPLIGLMSLVVQISLGVHAVRTGRDLYWIYILVIPVVGPTVYIITQILPGMFSHSDVRKARNRLADVVDPQRELRKRKDELERADTLENRRLLAVECTEAGLFDEAIELYRSCLQGEYANDVDLLQGLARAQFGNGDYADCRKTLEQILEHHPGIVSQAGHLLYARCLEALGDSAGADLEYGRLVDYATGEEARMRYARFLNEAGRRDEGRKLCEETMRRARLASKAYRKTQSEWVREAERMLESG